MISKTAFFRRVITSLFENNVDLYRTAIEVCEVDPDWSLAFVPENENNNEEGLTVVE